MGIFSQRHVVLFFAATAGVLHAQSAAELNNLGARLFGSGQYREAEALLARAIEIWSSTDPPPADLETALHNLAACYRAEERFTDAAPLYERAIELREIRTGPSDLTLLPPLTGLALLYLEKRDLARSKQITKRAISIADLHANEQTGESAGSFLSLGSLLALQGQYADGRAWINRALLIRQRLFGEASAESAEALIELATAERRARRFEEASEAYRRAFQIYQEQNDIKRASVMRNLAELLLIKHKNAEAQQLLEHAECILDLNPSENALELGRTKASMANLRFSEKRFEEAAALYREALSILEPILGSGNTQLLSILGPYARALRAGQDYAAAAAIDMQAMKIRVRQTLGKQG